MIRPRKDLVEELTELIAMEHRIEKLLERASRAPEDPRAAAWLWSQATECRDHARILARHRQKLDRKAPSVPYPRWKRGRGPTPDEALDEARELAEEIARQYHPGGFKRDDPYLTKFLEILADEHRARSVELRGLLAGQLLFAES